MQALNKEEVLDKPSWPTPGDTLILHRKEDGELWFQREGKFNGEESNVPLEIPFCQMVRFPSNHQPANAHLAMATAVLREKFAMVNHGCNNIYFIALSTVMLQFSAQRLVEGTRIYMCRDDD